MATASTTAPDSTLLTFEALGAALQPVAVSNIPVVSATPLVQLSSVKAAAEPAAPDSALLTFDDLAAALQPVAATVPMRSHLIAVATEPVAIATVTAPGADACLVAADFDDLAACLAPVAAATKPDSSGALADWTQQLLKLAGSEMRRVTPIGERDVSSVAA